MRQPARPAALITLTGGAFADWSDEELWRAVEEPTHDRLFAICELLRRDRSIDDIHARAAIDRFWLG